MKNPCDGGHKLMPLQRGSYGDYSKEVSRKKLPARQVKPNPCGCDCRVCRGKCVKKSEKRWSIGGSAYYEVTFTNAKFRKLVCERCGEVVEIRVQDASGTFTRVESA